MSSSSSGGSWPVTLVVIALPVLLRKYQAWTTRRSLSSSSSSPPPPAGAPTTLLERLRPINPLAPTPSTTSSARSGIGRVHATQYLSLALYLLLILYHLSALLRPPRDLFQRTALDPLRCSVLELRAAVAGRSLEQLGFYSSSAPWPFPLSLLSSFLPSSTSLSPSPSSTAEATPEERLQRLLSTRLASLDGRSLYLLFGASPLLDCAWCRPGSSSSSGSGAYADYALYALLLRARWYALQALWIGAATMQASSVRHLDNGIQAVRRGALGLGLAGHAAAAAAAAAPGAGSGGPGSGRGAPNAAAAASAPAPEPAPEEQQQQQRYHRAHLRVHFMRLLAALAAFRALVAWYFATNPVGGSGGGQQGASWVVHVSGSWEHSYMASCVVARAVAGPLTLPLVKSPPPLLFPLSCRTAAPARLQPLTLHAHQPTDQPTNQPTNQPTIEHAQWHPFLSTLDSLPLLLLLLYALLYPRLGPPRSSLHGIAAQQGASYAQLAQVAADTQVLAAQGAVLRRRGSWQQAVRAGWEADDAGEEDGELAEDASAKDGSGAEKRAGKRAGGGGKRRYPKSLLSSTDPKHLPRVSDAQLVRAPPLPPPASAPASRAAQSRARDAAQGDTSEDAAEAGTDPQQQQHQQQQQQQQQRKGPEANEHEEHEAHELLTESQFAEATLRQLVQAGQRVGIDVAREQENARKYAQAMWVGRTTGGGGGEGQR